ncbi:AhpC/TSA family protein [Flammeovirga sp. MY04]|uniref:peroxiredoxin-like family protein n=1 Tax=Flammeovirga sp. MY04 TaxID=1191459 RepID=UPI00080616EC|nr:peroxiredoxin-like family protein [Flammeovirga sp. MY04]ANQ51173.1 AhpC/TSA family protein [Flammeovirga sp. MY04]
MKLSDALARLKDQIEGKMSSEFTSVMHQATADLIASGIGDQILKEGDKAPEFSLPNQDCKVVALSELIKDGPAVVTFYRGVWCPYCNTDLGYLKRYQKELEKYNAKLISISPQIAEKNQEIIDRQRLDFDLLSDKGNDVAAKFGLRWTMEGALKDLYDNNFNIHLPSYNGDDSWTLPVPARFIIGTDGIIKYAEFSIDYTQRPDPEVLEGVLKTI